MKILFVSNIIPVTIVKHLNNEISVYGGWISSLLDGLKSTNLEISVCFPFSKKNIVYGVRLDGVTYYSFASKYKEPTKYDNLLESKFREILEIEKPDIVHVFGTEYPHTLAMIRAFNRPQNIICHIQGLVSVYGRHYVTGLPQNVCQIPTLRDFLRRDSITQQQKKFYLRGKFETEALKSINHIMGRTEWDKACTAFINPKAEYHYVQEILRNSFYEGKWEYENCEKYSIFMSQGFYPIKGLHYVLEALSMLKEKYENIKLYIGGESLQGTQFLKESLLRSSYSKYISRLIKKNDLHNNVIFLGNLSEKKMKELFLRCNVFVSASTIENSPNSVGEALLLGVPVVSSDVGGISSIAVHNETAFLYPVDEPYMLAHYVKKIFTNTQIGINMGNRARKKALVTYDKTKIINDVINCYNFISDISSH